MYNTIGKSIPKYDAIGHVTGRTVYATDMKVSDMLVVKTLRSPYKKARIHNIDLSEALKLKGVYGIVTKDDVPYNKCCAFCPDQHVLAEEIVRHKGQNIAAVAAVDRETALEAISKIKLDLEELPAVIDPTEAMKEEAPLVRPDHPEGNIHLWDGKYKTIQLRKGDVEAGFKEADFIVEGSYRTPSQEHAPLEPCGTIAYVDGTGKLIVYSKTQGPFTVLGELSQILKLPLSKIRVNVGTVGGAFGGMLSMHTDHIASLLAVKTGKPVKYVLTREEEMCYSTHRNPWFYKYKDGIRKDGVVTARRIEFIHDSGAFSEMGPALADKDINYMAGPYNIKNVSIDGYVVYTNKMPSGAMRGFGVNIVQFAEQVQTEKLARTAGLSPIEFRIINSFREGDLAHAQNPLTAVSAIETLQNVAEMAEVKLSEKCLAMKSDNNQ